MLLINEELAHNLADGRSLMESFPDFLRQCGPGEVFGFLYCSANDNYGINRHASVTQLKTEYTKGQNIRYSSGKGRDSQ